MAILNRTQFPSHRNKLKLATIGALAFSTTAHADVIIEVDKNVESQKDLMAYIADIDQNGWDEVQTGSIRVGDGFGTIPNKTLMGAVELNIDAYRAEIAAAASIRLEFVRWFQNGNPDLTIQAYAFNTTAEEDGVITVDDATTSATLLTETYEATDLTTNGDLMTFDVTNVVKADGLELSNDWSGFRISSSDAYNTADGSSAEVFRIARLVIVPVPEPGSLALLGLGGLCVLQRRRK